MIDLNIIQIKIVPTGYLRLRSILIWCLSLGLKFQAAHSYVFQILGFKHLLAQESVSFTNKYQTATQQYCMLSFFFSPHSQLSGCLAILKLYKYVLRTIKSIKRSISILSLSLFIARCSFAFFGKDCFINLNFRQPLPTFHVATNSCFRQPLTMFLPTAKRMSII